MGDFRLRDPQEFPGLMLCQILLPQQFKDQKSNLCSQVEFVSIGQAQVGKDIPRAFLEPYFQSVSLPPKNASASSWHSGLTTIKKTNDMRQLASRRWPVAAHLLLKSRRMLIVSY